MRVVGLVSGGKDSCYNMVECARSGHEVVALAHLYPPAGGEMDSFMYQTVGSEAVHLYAEAMGLPLFTRPIVGASSDTGSGDCYTSSGQSDEVEDLFHLLAEVKAGVPSLEAVSVGAILSNYQRVRVEAVCARLGLQVLAFLWRRNQVELLDEMLACGLDAIIIKVAAFGLTPERHLGRRLADVRDDLVRLAASPAGLNACGEGGEYETLTLDCPPLFRRGLRLAVSATGRRVVVHSDDAFAPVCYLRLDDCRLVPREEAEVTADAEAAVVAAALQPIDRISPEAIRLEFESAALTACQKIFSPLSASAAVKFPPLSVVNVSVCEADSSATSAMAAKLLMTRAAEALLAGGVKPLLCILQVPDMSAFADINAVYADCFASSSAAAGLHQSPPARACVELPPSSASSGVQMSLSILAAPVGQAAEVAAMHVRSRSHWAPANIGPYSQCCRLLAGGRSGDQPPPCLAIISGQIGMDPATLELPPGDGATPLRQAALSLRHVWRVAAAANGSADSLAAAVRAGGLLAICFCLDAGAAAAGREAFHRLVCRRPQAGPESGGGGLDCPICQRSVVAALCTGLPKGAAVEWLTFLAVGDGGGVGVDYAGCPGEISSLLMDGSHGSRVAACLWNEAAAAKSQPPPPPPPPGVMWIRCAGFPGRPDAAAAVAWLSLPTR